MSAFVAASGALMPEIFAALLIAGSVYDSSERKTGHVICLTLAAVALIYGVLTGQIH